MSFWLFQYVKSMGDNFGVVVPGHIYRSAQPSALCELRDKYGIRAVLNLRDNAGPKERRDAEKAGLVWHQIPMKDVEAPTPDQIRDALDVLRSGVPVLVHCKGGRHR